MSVEVRDGVMYIGLSVENVVNMCQYLPDFREARWDELPEQIKEMLVPVGECIELKMSARTKTLTLLDFIKDGPKSTEEIYARYPVNDWKCILANSVTNGYLISQGDGVGRIYSLSRRGVDRLTRVGKGWQRNDTALQSVLDVMKQHPRVKFTRMSLSRSIGWSPTKVHHILQHMRMLMQTNKLPPEYKCIRAIQGRKHVFLYWYEE